MVYGDSAYPVNYRVITGQAFSYICHIKEIRENFLSMILRHVTINMQ